MQRSINYHLAADPESVALIEKLLHRIGILSMGDFDLGKALSLPAILGADVPIEEYRQMIIGAFVGMIKEKDKSISQRAKYTELIDVHEAYVKALEERCHALTEEFKTGGGDTSKYPTIPKL